MKVCKSRNSTAKKILIILITCFSTQLHASEEGYLAKCAACHMNDAGGHPTHQSPAIAGMQEAYLIRQLNGFKQGLRGHSNDDSSAQLMRTIAMTLSDSEIDSISRYIASLAVPKLAIESTPASFRGRGLYSECASCHGAKGSGNASLNAPRLAHQYPWYLKKQLESFKAKRRGFSDDDHYGSQMSTMAEKIDNSDLDTLVNHITNLGR